MRKATPEDAAAVIPLISSAIGEIGYVLTGTQQQSAMLEALESFFRQKGNRLSHDHVYVLERNGEIAGFALAYHGQEIEALDAPLKQHLRQRGLSGDNIIPEAKADEYYLDSVAVHPAFQGQGVGTLLIREFEQKALQLGHHKVLLIVDVDNIRAKALYERLGYKSDGIIEIGGRAYTRMTKQPERM
ncbi:GNAT family N-acetyltransferase [Paenibacillus campi]|uniref:GNAT family N-acetyltransferase n=1 Tax=Paenibacillus campi TaxID=3106031 RepID=UPI002AFDFE91|nr:MULTISPECIES: GNAT family N-acetyltransferase [unclassified Paenibacillus]